MGPNQRYLKTSEGPNLKTASMEAEKGNMAPGGKNAPEPGKLKYNAGELPPEQIVEGARNEDQLDRLKENAPQGDERPQRTTPDG